MVQLQLGGCIFHQRRPPKSARDCSTVHNTSFYQHNIVQIHRFNPTCPQHELNLGSILAKKKPLTWAQLMKRCCKCLSLPFLWKILAKANWQCSWEQRPLEGNQNISRSCVLCQSPLPRHIRVPNHLKRGRKAKLGRPTLNPWPGGSTELSLEKKKQSEWLNHSDFMSCLGETCKQQAIEIVYSVELQYNQTERISQDHKAVDQ